MRAAAVVVCACAVLLTGTDALARFVKVGKATTATATTKGIVPEPVVQVTLPVLAVAIDADGRRLMTGGEQGAQVFDLRSGLVWRTFTGNATPIVAVGMSPDGGRFAAATTRTNAAAAEVIVFDGDTGAERLRLRETAISLLYSDETLLVGLPMAVRAYAPDGTIRWACQGRLLGVDDKAGVVITREGDRLRGCRVRDGQTVAVSDDDVMAARLPTGFIDRETAAGKGPAALAAAVTPPREIVVDTNDGLVVVGRDGAVRRTIPRRAVTPVRASLSPDGAWLATTEGLLWDLALGRIHRTIPRGHDVVFVGDGDRLLVLGDDDTRLIRRDGGEPLWQRPGRLEAVALDASRTRALFLGTHETIDFATLSPWSTTKLSYPERVESIALSPDASLVAAGTSGLMVSVGTSVIDVASGERWPSLLTTSTFGTRALTFSADGRHLASAGYGSVPQLARVRRIGSAAGSLPSGHQGFVSAVAFSPAEPDLLLSGGEDGAVHFWSAGRLQRVGSITVGSAVQGLSFSADGRRVAVAAADGSVHLVDVARRARVATLIGGGPDTFITMLADGRYRASRAATTRVAFRVGREVYPFDQFDLRLHRPHDVLSALGRADQRTIALYRAAFQQRLRKAGLTDDAGDGALSGALPTLSLSSPPPMRATSPQLELDVTADGAGRPILKVDVVINGVPVHGRRGLRPPSPDDTRANLHIPITLGVGRNQLQLSVTTTDGVESLRETLEVEGAFTAPAPRTWVVGVGVGEHRERPLRFAVKDAVDVIAAMSSGPERARLLQDREVTRASLGGARDWLSRAGVDDTVVVFISGHGLLDASLDYWFGTVDVDFEHPETTGIPWSLLEDLVDGIPARRKLMIMDTCNSGELDPREKATVLAMGTTARAAPTTPGAKGFLQFNSPSFVDDTALAELQRELFADLRRGTGAVVLSSAGGLEIAQEAAGLKNGIFTWVLLDGLKGRRADGNGDGRVLTTELRDWIVPRVLELSGGAQRPTTRREQLEFDFAVPMAP